MGLKFIVISIIIEVIVAAYLGVSIYKKTIKSGEKNINPIDKKSLKFGTKNLQYFYEPKPNQVEISFSSWMEKKFTYPINSDGLVEKQDYTLQKEAPTYRIMTMGDSFTYGIFVQFEDNWTEKLEKQLNDELSCEKYNKFEVINLAFPGYEAEYSIERFNLKGKKYKPDLILWLVKDDDIYEINEKIAKLIHQYKIKESSDEYEAGIKADATFRNTVTWTEIFNYQKRALQKMNSFYPAKLILFTLPTSKQEVKKIFRDFAKGKKDVFFYEGMSDIYSLDGSFRPHDNHPNEKGHEIIAGNMYKYLLDNFLFFCNNI